MSLQVRWTITPLRYPQPWRPCSHCNQQRPYRCSGKFRLNANGRRLDAWLIYNCIDCDERWNHPILERVAANGVDRDVLNALQANDLVLIRRFAFDVAALRRRAHRVEEFAEVAVEKETLAAGAQEPSRLEIGLIVHAPVCLRLDRLLAQELRIPRSRIADWARSGLLETSAALNKPVRDGSVVSIADCGEGCAHIVKVAGS